MKTYLKSRSCFSRKPKKVVLLGFPNVGKSLLFHCLTGSYATVSNYPGTTVEITRGKGKIRNRKIEVIDTPGIYGLQGGSEEERATLRLLAEEKPSLILFVIEAAALPRMLYMLPIIQSFEVPIILLLNMADEAEKKGIVIDAEGLERYLNIPVVLTDCVSKKGLEKLTKKMEFLLFYPSYGKLPEKLPGAGLNEAKEKGRKTHKYTSGTGAGKASLALTDGGYLKGLQKDCFQGRENRLHLFLINPLSGYPLAFLSLVFCFYFFLGVLGAGTVVRYLEGKLFWEIVTPIWNLWGEKIVKNFYLKELLMGEFGLISMGLRYSLVILLPLVSMFFLFFALLEDSGYLPRLAYLLHRPLGYLGLGGRGSIPLIMGFGCGSMAVLATKLLETPRERFLATFLLSLGIPCSSQLALLVAILAPYPSLLFFWGVTWGAVFVVAGTLLNRFYPGKRKYSCVEFPPLRVPRLLFLGRKTIFRLYWYIFEVVPFFLLISFCFQLFKMSGLLKGIETFLSPIFTSLGLPPQMTGVFLFGFLRRDYAAAGLYDLMVSGILSPRAALVGATVLAFFFPCLAQLTILFKEIGFKGSLLILVLIALISYAAGLGIHLLLSILDFPFS